MLTITVTNIRFHEYFWGNRFVLLGRFLIPTMHYSLITVIKSIPVKASALFMFVSKKEGQTISSYTPAENWSSLLYSNMLNLFLKTSQEPVVKIERCDATALTLVWLIKLCKQRQIETNVYILSESLPEHYGYLSGVDHSYTPRKSQIHRHFSISW